MRELFISFGGHAQAAGFSFKIEYFDEFKTRFNALAAAAPGLDKASP